ncbi:hypothetical protein OTK49_01280 [Vibrio coralliirubri]|uniref:hypothetical protein n=1 Tax=Vibrio coralliirubri TaxID=1516159 RepID=UPI002283F987|nr:hypothetical protein [Vibrio coralliirubri]MCY9861161.1 hypothetical protein [Vibrio coralliirubri]
MTTSSFPTLDMIPVEFHKDSVLIRYRRAITDERLDQMHERVKRDLLKMLNNGTFSQQAYKVALTEADRAYGARQEEFDNPSASLLERRSKRAVEASANSPKIDSAPSRSTLAAQKQRSSRSVNLTSRLAKCKPVSATQPLPTSTPSSSWATAEQDLKRLLNQMSN